MPANHTPNYQLSQWERADKVLMEDFNADNAKTDAAIKAVDVRVDGKADRSALEALTHLPQNAGDCVYPVPEQLPAYAGAGADLRLRPGRQHPPADHLLERQYRVLVSPHVLLPADE